MTTDSRITFWERVKFFSIAGVGFFADGYLNLTISLVVPILGYLYWQDNKNAMPVVSGDVIKGCLPVGLILGQITFGYLGDTFGRKKVYGRELMFTMFGTLMCILLPWKGLSHNGIVAWMAVWRLFTGFGIGGDYPMTTVLSAENTVFGTRSKVLGVIRVFLASGSTIAYTVLIILMAAFKDSIEKDIHNLQYVWRLMMGIGLIPCALTVYGRLTMNETEAYARYVKNNGQELAAPEPRTVRQQWHDFRVYFADWRHAAALFSVCLAWFLQDVASYGVAYNQSSILASIGFVTGNTPYSKVRSLAVGNLIGQAAGYLPGYIPAIWLPQLLGRIKMQIIFCFMAMVIFAVWAGVVNTASTGGSFTLLIIGQLVIDGGVTATILILPTELWPTRVRATAFGVAAASGQCGAVLTAFAFGSAAKAMGLNGMFGLFAGLYLIIILVTFLVPETRDATLPELESDALYDKKWGHRRREALQRSNESKGEEEEAANSATLTCVSGKQAEA